MLKKLMYLMMASTAMLFATSCEKDVEVAPTSVVTFNVGSPELVSRAYSDGMTATVLQYAVYDENGTELTALTKKDATINGSTTVNLQLTTGNTYSVIFWAAAPNAPYTVDFATKTMTVDYNAATTVSNDENRDAFYKYHTFTVTGAQTETIELKRPFAQLNIGTSDYTAAKNAGYEPKYSSVTVKQIYTTLKMDDGTVATPVDVTFDYAAIPTAETFPVSGYEYLAMNYLLVAKDKETIDIEFGYTETDATAAKTRTVGSVPVQRNYRTNIYGQLFTSDVNINVEINPDYEPTDKDGNVHLEDWDGTELNEPTFDATTKTYFISHASELAYIAQLVNGTLDTDNVTLSRAAVEANSLKGYTVKLECDINLNGKEWTPIGTSTNSFQGTFDGNSQTIKNLVITSGKSDVGLFGFTTNGQIKNLTVENAKVKGRLDVGVVAGTPYTSKYNNIVVKGHVEVDGMSYVGAVGGKNAYASWDNIIVDVDANSYVNANSVENGTNYRTYVGGVIGFMGEGNHTVSNVVSNINVKGSTCDVGGIVGIAHYGNTFTNVTCNADVEIYAATEQAEADEIGGIAGVWMNSSANQPVTFKNCKFTGELKVNDPYTVNTNKFGNLVCAAYKADGPGKLIIDGVEYMQTANGATVDGVLNSFVETSDELIDAFKNGGKVTLVDDVDLSEVLYITDDVEVVLDLNGKTITVSDVNVDPAIYMKSTRSTLTIEGNGTIELEQPSQSLIVPYGEVIINGGNFIKKRVPDGVDGAAMFVGMKDAQTSVVINGGYFDSGYYDKNADLEFSETEADIANRGKSSDKNLYRTAIKKNISYAFNLSQNSFKIYGGTFVGANPAWGDEGTMMPITPKYLRPWSYYQGGFLEGQVQYDDKIVIPAGYTITEDKTDDGRPRFTVTYSK